MINIEQTDIKNVILHHVSSDENDIVINDQAVEITSEQEGELLKKIFLKPFLLHSTTFEFKHDVGLEYNVLFNLCKNINSSDNFIEDATNIAKHLTATSSHHQIKNGDLFVVHFNNIILSNKAYDAVGLYKYEEKDSFVETSIMGQKNTLEFKKGIGSKKPDKACLVLFTEEPFTLLVIDSNKETDYWQNEFIKLQPKNDFVNNTNNVLTIAKNFITKQVPEDFEVNKTDQIDLLNRSVEYFKNHETFEKEEFEQQVFQDENVIESFRSFDETFREKNDLTVENSFEISEQAVKKQARVFKSVLKLDKNFHIYIHGDKELIEQGVEKDGRKFYKIYYEAEK